MADVNDTNTLCNEVSPSLESLVADYLKLNKVSLFILTPMYGSVCHAGYLQSIIKTIDIFKCYGISLKIEFCRNDSLVTRARNNLIAKAMSHSDTTHILFIDSDISWDPNDVLKLILSDKSLIGGVYPLKKYEFSRVLPNEVNNYDLNPVKTMISGKKQSQFTCNMSDEEIVRYKLLRYNLNYIGSNLEIDRNIAKVKHVATGFMMMKRELIHSMSIAYPSTKYTDDVGFLNGTENDFAFALFDCAIEDGHYLSEDWYFCSRWSKLGGDVFIDVTINLTHTGNEDFKGSFLSSVII
jgi:hypothetical protein